MAIVRQKPKVPVARVFADLEDNEEMMKKICDQWEKITESKNQVQFLIGYLRGVLLVEKSLKKVARVREIKFLIGIAQSVYHEK